MGLIGGGEKEEVISCETEKPLKLTPLTQTYTCLQQTAGITLFLESMTFFLGGGGFLFPLITKITARWQF